MPMKRRLPARHTTPLPGVGCPHPPDRLYSGTVTDPLSGKENLWVACCACRALLKSGYGAATLLGPQPGRRAAG